MIEGEQHDPILVLLPLVVGPSRAGTPEIAQLAPGLQGHAQGDALPGHEYSTGQLAVEPALSPARDQQGTPECVHGTDVLASQGIGRNGCRLGGWAAGRRGSLRTEI